VLCIQPEFNLRLASPPSPSGYGAAAFASASRHVLCNSAGVHLRLARPPSPFGLRRGSLRFRFAALCFAIQPEFNLRLAERSFREAEAKVVEQAGSNR